MHELGHNLGLRHGGGDNTNRKPNFLSVMNYAFQLTGLTRDGSNGVFDYSMFPTAGQTTAGLGRVLTGRARRDRWRRIAGGPLHDHVALRLRVADRMGHWRTRSRL